MTFKHLRSVGFLVLGAALTAGCGSSSTPAAATPSEPPAAAAAIAPAAPTAVDPTSWEAFYPTFQAAVASGDIAQVRALVAFGDELDEGSFNDNFEIFFSAEVKSVIATSSAAAWPESENEAGVREVAWSDSAEVDGEVYESALIFYFKKVDGAFRLFRWMAAG